MRMEDAEFIASYIRMATDGWEAGWHERNGGNLTYRIKPAELEPVKHLFDYSRPWTDIGTEVPGLGGEFFLVTGSGKYFRNIRLSPEENIGIIEIDGPGKTFRILWGLINNARPTSELPSHLMNHEVKVKTLGDAYRVIYHCHPSNIIALSFVLPLKDEVFTRELWESMTECPVVFPGGVGVVPWMVPGGRDIAVESAKLMKDYNVIVWAHHGIFCAGEDFDITFGLAHTVEKSAEILVKVLSMSPNKLQTIQTTDFRNLAKAFGITLPEKFLG